MYTAGGATAPKKTESKVLYFTRELPGLEGFHHYFLEPLPDNQFFVLLRSVEEESVALILVDPFPFFPHYRVELTAEDRLDLKIEYTKSDVLTYTTVAVTAKKLFTNLAAPLVINAAEKLGKQLILPELSDKLRVPLALK